MQRKLDIRVYTNGVVVGLVAIKIRNDDIYTVVEDSVGEYSIHKIVGRKYGRKQLEVFKDGFKTPQEALSFLYAKFNV